MPGHIRKRGKRSWAVVVDYGQDPLSGKRRRVWRSVKGTKKEAEAVLVKEMVFIDMKIMVEKE